MKLFSNLLIAVSIVAISPAAHAQLAPSPVANALYMTPEEFVASERAYHAGVTADTVVSALSTARHQCRYWLKDHPGTIKDARRQFRHAMIRNIVSFAVMSTQGSAIMSMSASGSFAREMSNAHAAVDCHKLLDPSPAHRHHRRVRHTK